MPTMSVLCLYYAYYACTMPTMPVLCLYYAYYACTMPTMPVLCLLCLYYAYYACTMPTMPVLCLLCLFITTRFPLGVNCWHSTKNFSFLYLKRCTHLSKRNKGFSKPRLKFTPNRNQPLLLFDKDYNSND